MSTVKELINYRSMISNLIKRDIRGRYKGSVLGFLWNFILPLVQIIVFTLVFGSLFQNKIEHYPIYLISGMVFWIWFSESISEASGVLVSNSDLLKKIYFPRMILPIVSITSKMVNFLIMLGITFVVMIVLQHGMTLNLLFLPLVIAITYIFLLGISLILSALNVFFRDIQYIVTALLMALIWMAPIMYMSSTLNNELVDAIIQCNPISYFVYMFHDVIYYGVAPQIDTVLICCGIAAVSFVAGCLVFRRLERDFAEVL